MATCISRAIDGYIPPFKALCACLLTCGEASGKYRLMKHTIIKVTARYVDDALNRFCLIWTKCIVRHVNHQSTSISVHNIVQHKAYDVCANQHGLFYLLSTLSG